MSLQSLIDRATQFNVKNPNEKIGRATAERPDRVNSRPGRVEPLSWAWAVAYADRASRIGFYLAWIFLLSAGLYAAVLGGHVAALRQTVEVRVETALVAGGFGIREVVIKGHAHVSRARIKEALGTSHARTIFGIDTRAARARLEQIGWIRSAQVMRLWPSTLVIEVRERKPFARWDIRGHSLLIDRQGVLLGPVTPAFDNLPRVAGEGADKAVADLVDTLQAFPEIARGLRVGRRIERRRWDLVMRGGIVLQLPAQSVSAALETGSLLLKGRLPERVNTVDLRVSGRVTLRHEDRETGKDGKTDRLSARPSRSGTRQL